MVPAVVPIDVFISYAAANEKQKDVLRKHLSALKHEGKVRTWHTGRIGVGSDRDAEIKARLGAAHLILLLVSVDYLAADAQWREMERALERHNAGRARVIPILLDACDWEGTPFSALTPLPSNRVPVMSWKRESEAWTSVTRAIRAAIADCTYRAAGPTLLDTSAPPRPEHTARAERTLDTSPAAAALPAARIGDAPPAPHRRRARVSTAARALIAILVLGPLAAVTLFIARFTTTDQPTGASAADAGLGDAGPTARPRTPPPRTVTVGEPEPRSPHRP
ncbi:toll/interleukin-1 receptor domain-containing protein [Sorangium sp. So ce1000]|uniref:toll/interleukin-1 receptor domain-containing protein n=1 Tax=Sorangium sp. So ce1000 TaxID=3133325 RepID=UPI003F63255A